MHNDYADRKNGRKPVDYLHPDAEEILGDTYGLMIYQESMMRVAQKFAGYSLAEADNLRKACGKKIRALIAKEREKFVAGCERTGYGRAARRASCSTSSSRSPTTRSTRRHAYGYGFIAYQTAYLKAHYPVEYLAALLTSVKTNLEKAAVYLNECRQLRHRGRWCPTSTCRAVRLHRAGRPRRRAPRSIPFGLSAVRNVGEGLVGQIVAEREANGPFADFYDFCERVDPTVLNKRTIESLIKAGGVRLARPSPQGSAGRCSSRSSTRRSPAGASATMGVMTLFGEPPATSRLGLRRAGADPRPRVRQGASGSPSRRRCSACT